LLIAPDGKLVLMPFGELRDADGRTLADRFLVSYLISGRDLQRIITAEEKAHGVVVIAAPDFDIETEATDKQLTASNRFAESGSFEPLPGTLREAEEIGLLLDTDRLLLGPAATVDALRNIRSPDRASRGYTRYFLPVERRGRQL